MVKRTVVWRGVHEEVKGFVATCATKPHNPAFCDGVRQHAIIVFVNRMSKTVRIAPIQTKVTAPGFAKRLVSNVVKHHGVPKAIVSDRDAKFTSHFWQALMRSMKTKLLMSSAYHPQTVGLTERANQTFEQMLRGVVNADHTDWDEHLDMVEFAYNNSSQASTGHSTFYLNYGEHPNTQFRWLWRVMRPGKSLGLRMSCPSCKLTKSVLSCQLWLRKRGRRDMQTNVVEKRNCVLERWCGCHRTPADVRRAS